MRVASPITPASFFALAAVVLIGLFAGAGGARAADADPFFGVTSQNPLTEDDFDTMQWGRVGAYRIPVAWGSVVSEDGEMNWGHMDRVVGATARRGIEVLPVLYFTPKWLAGDRRRLPIWGKRAIEDWKDFVKAAVLRFGTDGDFWVEHPGIPVTPVTGWQIWNEPNIRYFAWPVSPKRYARLVKISARVIRNFDPDARTVLAGLYARVPRRSGMDSGPFLDRAYRIRGFRSSFDAAAIHPYASTTRGSIKRTYPIRRVLNRHGHSRRELLVTELGWGSDSATVFGMGSLDGQGRQLTSAYRAFLHHRKRLNLESVYWFAWDDLPEGGKACAFCKETGLFDNRGEAKPAWYRLLDFTHSL